MRWCGVRRRSHGSRRHNESRESPSSSGPRPSRPCRAAACRRGLGGLLDSQAPRRCRDRGAGDRLAPVPHTAVRLRRARGRAALPQRDRSCFTGNGTAITARSSRSTSYPLLFRVRHAHTERAAFSASLKGPLMSAARSLAVALCLALACLLVGHAQTPSYFDSLVARPDSQ